MGLLKHALGSHSSEITELAGEQEVLKEVES